MLHMKSYAPKVKVLLTSRSEMQFLLLVVCKHSICTKVLKKSPIAEIECRSYKKRTHTPRYFLPDRVAHTTLYFNFQKLPIFLLELE